jgi:hypothetical protein
MLAADDLRRTLRRAGGDRGPVLRGFWVRLRTAWRGGQGAPFLGCEAGGRIPIHPSAKAA